MKKLAYVDALRGLAILGVIMVHTNQYGNSNLSNTANQIIYEGENGVQLFFLASAFTLFLSFQNRLTTEAFPVRNFFIRRLFRIAPMYYLGIIYYLFQDGFGPRFWLGDATHITFINIVSNFTFLHGLNPYWISSVVPGGWSIAVEMIFYLALPYLFSRIKNSGQALNFFILSLLIRFVLQELLFRYPLIGSDRLWTSYLYFYFPSQLPIFALGILMYFLISGKKEAVQFSGKSLLVLCLMIVAQMATSIIFIFPKHILFGIAFLFLGIGISKYNFKPIVNPLICFIGRISFSMYLVHFAVLYWFTKLNFINYFAEGNLNYLIRYFLVCMVSIIISTLLYYSVELPFQNIGKRIIFKFEKRNEMKKGILLGERPND